MDRLIATTLPDASQVTKSYGLWSETTSDQHGHPTTTTYDAYGRAVTKENWHSGQPVLTQFTYDRLGQLVGTEDALGNTWSWTFDSLGRNTQKNDPDAGIWSFEYDDAGRVKAQVDAKSQRIEFLLRRGGTAPDQDAGGNTLGSGDDDLRRGPTRFLQRGTPHNRRQGSNGADLDRADADGLRLFGEP